MTKEELLKLSPGELTDLGICPTCFNRENGGALYGDLTDKMLYEDDEIECFFVGNPRAEGHMCISTIAHYHDMSEAPDEINEKIVRFAKRFMQILCDVYGCERVYLCTMCDGPNNHYHVQLIPRYPYEKRGSRNFVKERKTYQFDKERFEAVRQRITQYVKETGIIEERSKKMGIIKLRENPAMKEEMAGWFHEKWGIPLVAYLDSMAQCLAKPNGVPQWYVAVENGRIVGGLGVIENDFHDRKDLTPNVCAVYVEEAHRCKGIAGQLLNSVCEDMREMGIAPLYLLTDHTGFYERYGWEFFCMAQGDGEDEMARMYIHK